MLYTEKEKIFAGQYSEEIAKVANANKVDLKIGLLMILNNAKILNEAMQRQGYKPGLSFEQMVKDAVALDELKITRK